MVHQSLVLENFDHFVISTRDDAELLPNFARVQILATGICGSDIHGASGTTGRRYIGQVMGHETCAVVMAVNSKDSDYLVGKRVAINPVISCDECDYCLSGKEHLCRTRKILGVTPGVDGAFSEFVVVPNRNLVILDDRIPDVLATAIEPLSVGFHAVQRAQISTEDRVLVIGGGPIGQSVAFACGRLGIDEVLISEPIDSKHDFLTRLGFASLNPNQLHNYYSSKKESFPTVVFDAVGNSFSFKDAIAYSDVMAKIVLIGMDAPDLTIPSYAISADERSVIGSYCYTRSEFISTANWLADNVELVSHFISHEAPLNDAPAMFKNLIAGNFEYNRVVITLPSSVEFVS